jgi:hypothetical protein
MTGDQLELFFSSDRTGGQRDIYRSTRATTNDSFSSPVRVVELSGAVDDTGAISGDGLTFYVTHAGMPLAVAKRADRNSPFTMGAVDAELAQLANGTSYEISGDGLHAIATAVVTGQSDELFLFTRAAVTEPWGAPVNATQLNSPLIDGGGAFDATGLTVYFHSDRAGGPRRIYLATRARVSDAFGALTLVTELDHNQGSSEPWLAPDLRTILFNRDGDLYIATR